MLRLNLCRRYQPLFAVVCFCLSIAFAVPAMAQVPLYHGTDLGSLVGGGYSGPTAINASGQVVGHSPGTASGIWHAFLWLPTPAYGLPTGMNDLGTLPGCTYSNATAINDSGQVVGYSHPTVGNDHAFLWLPTPAYGLPAGMNDLGTLGGTDSWANGINASGQVVGQSVTASNSFHAFVWLPSPAYGLPTGMNDLGTLPGGTPSSANAINDSGQIVGSSYTASGDDHAFLWLPTPAYGLPAGMKDLGTLPGGNTSAATAINASGQVVGYSENASGDIRAFVWQNGTMLDLNKLLNSGGILSIVAGINDNGLIVDVYDYLVSPVGSILTNQAGNAGDCSLTLVYPGLQSGATIALNAGATTINGDPNFTSVVTDPNFPVQVLRTTFHLKNAVAGAYNVVVNSPGMPTVTLNNAFTVQQSGAPQIILSGLGTSTGGSQTRASVPSTFDFSITNSGTQDAVDVPVWIAGLPTGTPFTVSFKEPPDITGINVSDVNLWFTASNGEIVPLILPLVPAGATLTLQFQTSYPNALIGKNAYLQVWTSPLYSLLAANSSQTLSNAFKQLIGAIYQGAAGTAAAPNSLNQPMQTLLSQLSAISDDAYSNQSNPPPPTSFTHLLAQGVQLVAQNQKPPVTLSNTTILAQIQSVLNTALNNPTAYQYAYSILQPQALATTPVMVIGPHDPNSVIGPLGWLAGTRPAQFSLECGNDPSATGPAFDVLIKAHLNAAVFDPNTISLGGMQVVDQSLAPTPQIAPILNRQAFNADMSVQGVPITADSSVDLNPHQSQNSNLAALTNPLSWEFSNADQAGFLQPGQNVHVTFSVMPKAGLPTGTSTGTIWAEFLFDGSAYVDPVTKKPYKTWAPAQIDYDVPQSIVQPLHHTTQTNPRISVPFQWSKPVGGSGMQNVTLYVSEDNSGFVPWYTLTTSLLTGKATANYTAGQEGHTYAFYSIATDVAGNIQPAPPPPYHTVSIVPGPYLLSFTPNPVPGGMSGSGQVTINIPAPSGGAVVTLKNKNPAANLPASVTIPAGQTSQTFSFSTQPVTTIQPGTVTATYDGRSASATLKVRPIGVGAFKISPSTDKGGGSVNGTVTLELAAAPGNITVSFSSSNPSVVPAPANITIPAGTQTDPVTITTNAVTVKTTVTLKATANGISKSAKITVIP